jgi:lysophospholipid acyltransferase (LPLAT)-like uncharacterized protein
LRYQGLTYTSPKSFGLRARVTLTVASSAISCLLKTICRTCRSPEGEELTAGLSDTYPRRGLLALWHETLGLAVWHYRKQGYHTLTSYSFDGELAARIMERFGNHALRGSSSRGGSEALRQLEMASEVAPGVGFTPDGPRGPRRVAQPGIAILSARTGIPIVPQAFAATRCWNMNSWDRLIIPKPFATLLTAVGDPIPPPPDTSRDVIEETTRRVERELNRLQEQLDAQCCIARNR